MRTLLCFLSVILGGCVGLEKRAPAPVVQRVEVPVAVPCKVAVPPAPSFEVDALPIGATIWDQMRSLRAERRTRQAYELELEAAAKACSD